MERRGDKILFDCHHILYFTDRSRRRPNLFLYPQGKSRMEPVGIIIFSALMATVSVELLIQSVTDLIEGTSKDIDLGTVSIVLVAAAVGMRMKSACLKLMIV